MAKNWTCNGVPSSGKTYPKQNPTGKHEPYENFGADCVICGLPREAMENGSQLPKWIIPAAVTGAAVLIAGVVASIVMPKRCPAGQQKINDICVKSIISEPPVSPTPTVSPTPLVAPATAVTIYQTFAEVPNVPRGTFRYGGSTSFAPLRSQEILEQIKQAHLGFELSYTEPPPGSKPGTGSGIKMLIEGQLSFSQASRPLKEEELEKARTRSLKLEQQAVAIDGIVFYVNRNLSIPGLTLSQIKGIYTGRIKNWSEVGGSDGQITALSRDPNDGGTPDYFKETVLEKEDFASSVKPFATDTTTTIRKVAQTPGAIGYATASEVCPQMTIKPLAIAKATNDFVSPCIDTPGNQPRPVNKPVFANSTYPLTRRLFVVIKRDSTLDEQAGVAYVNLLLSDEGQKLVDQAGLVPLRH